MSTRPNLIRFVGDREEDVLNLVRQIKINSTIDPNYVPANQNYSIIADVIEVYELAIIELWKYAFDKKSENVDKKNEFHQLCKNCFNLLEVLPVPTDQIKRIKHVLKLMTYSYLGEKWEDMNRILKNNDEIWKVSTDSSEWDLRLFSTIYLAIVHLIRKKDSEDLKQASKLIEKLRAEQKKYEKLYLENRDLAFQKGAAYDLAALYHLAKSVELLGEYMLQGTPSPSRLLTMLDLQFENALKYCTLSRHMELDLILRMLQLTFKKMIENSIWMVANRVNSKVKTFTDLVTKSPKPVFELMYPQRTTILEKGLLDPINKAIVVTLPTSSGKTMIAEFRILQALNQSAGQNVWIAYVVPTKALVNQITARLRKDLGKHPLNIKVEKMSGALEPDAFERNLLNSQNSFDILVVTPEKLNLLIRQGTHNGLNSSLVLAIIDEAHNLGDRARGLNLEMLIAIIKSDCEKANLLLLTPFLPNGDKIAEWIDPENPKSIGIDLDWRPNDSVVGLYYATGKRRNINTFFKPLLYPPISVETTDEIPIDKIPHCNYPISKIRDSKYLLSSLVAEKLIDRGNVLILSGKVSDTWTTAKTVSELLPEIPVLDKRVSLVQKFIAAELGDDFPLVEHLSKGVGVHNAGLPEEIKELMEWLMENNLLKILVSTTTIAQGMNFPVSSILLSTYSYSRHGEMPTRDFLNLAGRAGRLDHSTMGLVGIAVDGKETEASIKAMKFVRNSAEEIISVLAQLLDDAVRYDATLNLELLANNPDWSDFLQYLAHVYNQTNSLDDFISQAQITLRNTYGYHQLDPAKKSILSEAINTYAKKLDKDKKYSNLSDVTGFSPETVKTTIEKIESLGIEQKDWESSNLFSASSTTLTKLMGIMLNDIPEIKKDLAEINLTGTHITHDSLSRIVSDWVSGKELSTIATEYFGGNDTKSLRNCVTAIYGKLSHFATWGVSSIQKLSPQEDSMTEQDRRKLSNLPAMIYYGVNSDEAILMRMNNMPRSISQKAGELFVQENRSTDLYSTKSTDVVKWLREIDDHKWDSFVPPARKITGNDYRQIWQTLAGLE